MKNPWDDVIIRVRRQVIKDMIVPKETEHFKISKDLKKGKLVFTLKKKP